MASVVKSCLICALSQKEESAAVVVVVVVVVVSYPFILRALIILKLRLLLVFPL